VSKILHKKIKSCHLSFFFLFSPKLHQEFNFVIRVSRWLPFVMVLRNSFIILISPIQHKKTLCIIHRSDIRFSPNVMVVFVFNK